MAMTVPTREGQGLGEFLAELQEAARRLMYLASDPANCWVSVEADSITDAEVVVELHCYDGEDCYYRAPYSRDDAGRIVLGEPVPVREVTSYEPVSAPPMQMAAPAFAVGSGPMTRRPRPTSRRARAATSRGN